MVYAPLVMPEVITGLSLLLLFVALDIRAAFGPSPSPIPAPTTCFVAVVVQSRLLTFDRSIEEAALDLGCPPLKAFPDRHAADHPAGRGVGLDAGFHRCRSTIWSSPASTTGPSASTLPMRIYSYVRLGVTPQINAACTLLDRHRRRGRDHQLRSRPSGRRWSASGRTRLAAQG